MIFIHLTYTPPKQYNSISYFLFFIAHAKFQRKLIDESSPVLIFCVSLIYIYVSHYNISNFHVNANAKDIQDSPKCIFDVSD